MSGFQRPSSSRVERPGRFVTARRRRRSLAATGVAAVAVGVLATGCGASAGDDKDPENRSFALSGRTLTVDSDDSALELVAPTDVGQGPGHPVVPGQGHDRRGPRGDLGDEGRPLKLRMNCSGVVADCAAKHRIEVPRGVAVTVKDDDGSVRARRLQGGAEHPHGDGSVRVRTPAGPLTLRTDDGSVQATGIDSKRVNVNTKDGSVRLELAAVPDQVTRAWRRRFRDHRAAGRHLPCDYRHRRRRRGCVGAPGRASSHVVSAHTRTGKSRCVRRTNRPVCSSLTGGRMTPGQGG